MAQNPRRLGIGIDESTPCIVEHGRLQAIGAGAVYVVDGHGVSEGAAEAAVRAGRVPDAPLVLVVQPSRFDPTRAPRGLHVVWAYCHVPNGWTGDATEAIERRIEHHAPGFRDLIVARVARGPARPGSVRRQ